MAILGNANTLTGNFLISLPVIGSIASSRYGDLITAGLIMAVAMAIAFLSHFLMKIYEKADSCSSSSCFGVVKRSKGQAKETVHLVS